MNYEFLKIALIFIFGLIATETYNIYLPRSKKLLFKEKLLYSFLYGIYTYLIYDGLRFLKTRFIDTSSNTTFISIIEFVFNNISKEHNFNLKVIDIIVLSIISILLGVFLSWVRAQKLMFKIGNKLRLKDTSVGGDSLLENIYEIDDETYIPLRNMWVQVKMLDGSASYFGDLKIYEVYSDKVELLLLDVTVYFKKNNLKKTYEQYAVYLNLKPGTFKIEYNNG